MSNIPGYPPDDHSIQYVDPPARMSGMAIASMVLGIAGIVLGCVVIGILPGILGLIFGIISLLAINKRPAQLSGKGFALTGVILGSLSIIGVPLLIAYIFVPMFERSREFSNRSVCAANLRDIAQSMAVYASDYNDAYPIVSARRGYSLAAGGTGTPQFRSEDTIVSMYAAPQPSVTQNMWLLVLTGQVHPRQFQCKSDPATLVNAATSGPGGYFTNFNDGTAPSDLAYSYSFTYPWSQTNAPGVPAEVGGWWRHATDATLPLIADIAPLNGTGSPVSVPTVFRDRNANSLNHQRDGQNVTFGDTHVEFFRMPAVGMRGDNIFTGGGGTPTDTGTQSPGVVPPIGSGGVPGAWDTYMVPAADSTTHIRR